MLKILFIDRDGTLIEEPEDEQVDSLDKIKLMPGVISSLQCLGKLGYRFVMVSNQDGLGTDSFPDENFHACQSFLLDLFRSQEIEFDEVFVCPHWDHDNCNCRKPRTGLLTQYLVTNTLDLAKCAVIGDRPTDMELADHLGIRGIPVLRDSAEHTWANAVTILTPNVRIASDKRVTRETSVEVSVNLDQTTPIVVDTGLGFYDHMLEQIAKHGGFALRLNCVGDTNVDEHHTIEDTAITLGKTLRLALGEKRGIARFGCLLPMDESEAQVSLDLSGRAYCKFDGDFPRDRVGQLPTEMVRHFFHSFADSLGATIHLSVTGENTHHMVEACFKAVGRALRQAVRIENDSLPSTKGVLS